MDIAKIATITMDVVVVVTCVVVIVLLVSLRRAHKHAMKQLVMDAEFYRMLDNDKELAELVDDADDIILEHENDND